MRIPEFWAGDEASLHSLLQTYMLLRNSAVTPGPLAAMLAKLRLEDDGEDEDVPIDELLADRISRVSGGVGVITLNGPMLSESNFWALLFGGVSYPAISVALDRFVANDEVSSVLLNVGTSGGDAVGIDEASQKIQQTDLVKPVYAWSGSRALSAGYWLGAAARKVYGSKMAEFGSVGVVSTHVSIARQLKEDGIDVTVVRAGEYKALGHPAEELSKKGLAELVKKTEQLNDFFLGHIAERRGLSINNKEQWAEGKTFFADEAYKIGLIDGVVSLKDVLSNLSDSHKLRERSMPKKIVMTEQAAAAVAAGVALEQVEHEEIEVAAEESDAASFTAAEELAPIIMTAHEDTELVSFLKQELEVERNKCLAAERQVIELKAQLSAAQTAESLLLPIVIEASQRMQVGLNQTPMELADLPATVVATHYSNVKSAFERTFTVGRKSLDSEKASPEVSSDSIARGIGITPKTSSVGSHPLHA